jgi:hypothetical protein
MNASSSQWQELCVIGEYFQFFLSDSEQGTQSLSSELECAPRIRILGNYYHFVRAWVKVIKYSIPFPVSFALTLSPPSLPPFPSKIQMNHILSLITITLLLAIRFVRNILYNYVRTPEPENPIRIPRIRIYTKTFSCTIPSLKKEIFQTLLHKPITSSWRNFSKNFHAKAPLIIQCKIYFLCGMEIRISY